MVIEISLSQYEVLGRSSFSLRMLDVIRHVYMDQAQVIDEEPLLSEIQVQLHKADNYGLNDERCAATYVMTAWLLGCGFDQKIPAASQILNSRDLSPAAKAKALEDLTLSLVAALEATDARALAGIA